MNPYTIALSALGLTIGTGAFMLLFMDSWWIHFFGWIFVGGGTFLLLLLIRNVEKGRKK